MTSSKKTKSNAKTSASTKASANAKSASKPKAPKDGKLSILDAAARVLKESGEPMKCKQMIDKMIAAKYWQTSGKTPAATLSSALQREITTKGKESRFRKTDRGLFGLT